MGAYGFEMCCEAFFVVLLQNICEAKFGGVPKGTNILRAAERLELAPEDISSLASSS